MPKRVLNKLDTLTLVEPDSDNWPVLNGEISNLHDNVSVNSYFIPVRSEIEYEILTTY